MEYFFFLGKEAENFAQLRYIVGQVEGIAKWLCQISAQIDQILEAQSD